MERVSPTTVEPLSPPINLAILLPTVSGCSIQLHSFQPLISLSPHSFKTTFFDVDSIPFNGGPRELPSR